VALPRERGGGETDLRAGSRESSFLRDATDLTPGHVKRSRKEGQGRQARLRAKEQGVDERLPSRNSPSSRNPATEKFATKRLKISSQRGCWLHQLKTRKGACSRQCGEARTVTGGEKRGSKKEQTNSIAKRTKANVERSLPPRRDITTGKKSDSKPTRTSRGIEYSVSPRKKARWREAPLRGTDGRVSTRGNKQTKGSLERRDGALPFEGPLSLTNWKGEEHSQ